MGGGDDVGSDHWTIDGGTFISSFASENDSFDFAGTGGVMDM